MASLDPDAAKSLELNESSWLRAARICDMGEYLVVTPIERDKKPIFVIRKGNPSRALFAATDKTTGLFDADRKRGLRGLVVQVSPDTTAVFNANGKGAALMVTDDAIDLFDVDGKRILFEVTKRQSGNLVRYSTYDGSRNAWIENIDFGPDGEVDFRKTDVSGRPQKQEFRIGNRWLERVERDGKGGVLIGGRFMSVAEARVKLGVIPEAPK